MHPCPKNSKILLCIDLRALYSFLYKLVSRPKFEILFWIWWVFETILFKRKVLYHEKIVTRMPIFNLNFQILGGKPIYIGSCTKPANQCTTKFLNFWAGMHFRGNVGDILWRAIKSKHLMYFQACLIHKYLKFCTICNVIPCKISL